MESFFKDNYAEDINTIGAREYNLYAVKGVFSYTNNKWLSLDAGTEYSYTDVIQTYNIDNSEIPQIIGTIAGDDTIFIVIKQGVNEEEVITALSEVVPNLR